MRIVGGKYRGRIINPPQKFSARPTTDFAKESLFNILNNHIDFEGIHALDLFAGTGSIGFELISRGAAWVDAVELNSLHHRFIKQTAERFGMTEYSAIKADAFAFVERCQRRYALIFADPPYNHERLADLPSIIFDRDLLEPDGWFVLEHPAVHNFGSHSNFLDHRTYGSVNFTFFKKKL